MKKIVFFSEESIFSGNIKCGIAEVVDSLAHSLTELYEVTIICKEGNSNSAKKAADFIPVKQGVIKGQFLRVIYYFIQSDFWPESGYSLIDNIKPDILHNFDNPELISKIQKVPARTIYTFDDLNYLDGREECLEKYDFITTFSKGYAEHILTQESKVVHFLKEASLEKISIGISTDIFDPEKGLFLPYSYNSQNLIGKKFCKDRLLDRLDISNELCVFLFMGRLIREKGLEDILKASLSIAESNSKIIVVGKGEEKYEKALDQLSSSNKIIYMKKQFSPVQIFPLLAGADFYLQPSLMESGGLMPMTASRYGAIPIVTQNGGLKDNFNDNNAIIIKNDIVESINSAIELYNNKEELTEKRQIVMSQEFGWDTRNKEFIRLYESI